VHFMKCTEVNPIGLTDQSNRSLNLHYHNNRSESMTTSDFIQFAKEFNTDNRRRG
jgi:hypothetical protein